MTPATDTSTIGMELLSFTDRLCMEATPLIRHCMGKLPDYYPIHYRNELYNTAIVAILENVDAYDPEKGSVAFFYKHIMSAFHKFIAIEVLGFSSYTKYRDYHSIRHVFPDIDSMELTEEIYNELEESTGLGKGAIISALTESRISTPLHFNADNQDVIATNGYALEEHVCTEELESVIAAGLNCLHGRDLEFVYDMCGFDGRPTLSPRKLQRKYGIKPSQYDSYLQDLRFKLLASRKLSRYMGRVSMHEQYRIH